MTMISGKLRHRVAIVEPVIVTDPVWGGTYETWNPIAEVWAQVSPLRGEEYWDAKKSNSEVTGRVTIRYRSDITPAMKLLHKGRYLEILYIVNKDERREMLEIYFKEVQT